MPANITYEKVEEIIRLAEKAAAPVPAGRRDRPFDPHREGPTAEDRRGTDLPCPPLEPQPAGDWREAFLLYLEELPGPALSELVGLYRFGRGEFDQAELAIQVVSRHPDPPDEQVAYLSSRADLAGALRTALQRR